MFAAEISVNPCETAIKGTKKLLAIVSTFASREFVLVEVAGVEPASQRGMMKTSTCLFHLQLFFVLRFANGQAILQNRLSLISQKFRAPETPARALIDAAYTLAPSQAQRRGGIMPPEQTLRSQLLF